MVEAFYGTGYLFLLGSEKSILHFVASEIEVEVAGNYYVVAFVKNGFFTDYIKNIFKEVDFLLGIGTWRI